MLKWLLPFLCFSASATNYFVATNGTTSGHDGLSTSQPWPIGYALANVCAPDNTVYIMPGVYNANYGSKGFLEFYNTGLSASHRFAVKALNPPTNGIWTVRITGGVAGGIGASTSPGYATDYVDFDGLEVCTNKGGDGISIGAFSTVTRCWTHHNDQNGINSSNGRCHDNLFEFNLVEDNGVDFTYGWHYHGIYAYGANNVCRNNVFRYNGAGSGVQFYSQQDATTGQTNNFIYNNLIYGNTNAGYGIDVYGGNFNTDTKTFANTGPNYVFNNTILDSILVDAGTINLSNNVINPSPGQTAVQLGGVTPTFHSDYNAGISTIHSDPNELITTWAGMAFVNTNRGLYWLQVGSTLRNAAKANVHLTNDFFGNSISTWPDIGAMQYSASYAADTRTLDPSTSTGAPYWALLPAGGTPPTITVNPVDKTANVGDNVTWTVTATGDTPLHYAWTWNGNADGTDSSSFTAPNVVSTDNNAKIKVTVSNASGSATSTTATLTVLSSGIYYASPSGSSANTGLTAGSPWPMPYALSHISGQNCTINLLPGVYPSTTWDITTGISGLTLTNYSATKWAAVLPSVSGNGIFGEIGVSNVTIVGIAVTNCVNCGIKYQSCNGWTVRDNWIYHNGEEGILSQHGFNHLIERNLCEWNGTTLGLNHGIYFNGTNSTLRGNVCRYNIGYGAQLYESCDNVKFYENLGYSNYSGFTFWADTGKANYAWNNVSIGNTNYALIADGGTGGGTTYFTNNIAQRTVAGDAIDSADSATIIEGYNLLNSQSVHAASDVISSSPGFVNTAKALYWITLGSAAHSAGVNKPPPVDFWGNPQSSITDIGMVQYSATYAGDTRNLEAIGSDFWAQLTSVAPAITLDITNQTVYAGANVLWYVTATGDSPLTYLWTWNGNADGTNGPTFLNPSVVLTDNGAHIQVTVTNSSGSATSTQATLTVLPSSSPPVITAQPQNTTVLPGQTANFSVTVTSQTQPTFQWKVNGSNSGSNTNLLSLTNRQLVNSGDAITCVITNPAGAVTSSTATLTVLPVILGVQVGGGVKLAGGVSFNK